MAERKEPTVALQSELEGLRQEWDRYIQGLEKRPPVPRQERFAKKLRAAMLIKQLGHVERFKLNQLQQRFLTLKNRWDRILRQIEDGTFRRERTNRPSAAPKPLVMPTTKPPTTPPTSNADQSAYERFRDLSESSGAAAPSQESFLKSLKEKRQALKEKHGFDVDFIVEDRAGKPSLKVVKSED